MGGIQTNCLRENSKYLQLHKEIRKRIGKPTFPYYFGRKHIKILSHLQIITQEKNTSPMTLGLHISGNVFDYKDR